MKKYKSGIIAVIGKPNSGKSTLINRIIGEKILLVSAKPQSSRYSIKGIKTTKSCQLVFIDTPGLHISDKLLNKVLLKEIKKALKEIDILLYLLEAGDEIPQFAEEMIKEIKAPKILAINKIDKFKNISADFEEKYRYLFGKIFYISALKGSKIRFP